MQMTTGGSVERSHLRCVQYGCGLCAPESWENFDGSLTLRVQRLPVIGRLLTRGRVVFPRSVKFGDVTRRLPIHDASCDLVYCSHVLEHLALDEFRSALSETYRILKPSGVFRLVLPDLEQEVRRYLADPGRADASVRFLSHTRLGVKVRPRGLMGLLKLWQGQAGRHLWMWDEHSLAAELATAGFVGVPRASFGDSGFAEFGVVEDEGRWTNCLGMQCQRPGPQP